MLGELAIPNNQQGSRQVTRKKSKSGVVVKDQRKFVVFKTTSNTNGIFKSSAVPLHRSLVTSLGREKKVMFPDR